MAGEMLIAWTALRFHSRYTSTVEFNNWNVTSSSETYGYYWYKHTSVSLNCQVVPHEKINTKTLGENEQDGSLL